MHLPSSRAQRRDPAVPPPRRDPRLLDLRHSSFASCALHQGGIASLAVTGMAISWRSALAVIASATPHIGNEVGVTSRSTM
jgi:hypothetical protein